MTVSRVINESDRVSPETQRRVEKAKDYIRAGDIFQVVLSRRLEVPFAMPALVWNMMMSMSGGWFFVVQSEAISVMNKDIKLPGLGSYMAQSIEVGDHRAALWAVLLTLWAAAGLVILYRGEAFGLWVSAQPSSDPTVHFYGLVLSSAMAIFVGDRKSVV